MKIAVALSGGVDSSVVAALLQKEGHEVIGITMKMGENKDPDLYCANNASINDAKKIAEHLNIPFYTVDVTKEFEKNVLNYIKSDYLNGRTPNPCVFCNRKVKFGAFISNALKLDLDFEYIATGHYAKVEYDNNLKRYLLKKANFLKKDQSYFLSMLTQEQLSRVIFPLGTVASKDEVRKIAKELKIPVFAKKDSQDFLSGGYLKIIEKEEQPGDILTVDGEKLGTHNGIWHYTIGQRRGLGIAYHYPLYVINIIPENNSVIVGPKDKLLHNNFTVTNINWIVKSDNKPIHAKTRIRYAHKEADSIIYPENNNKAEVKFNAPQSAITAGQVAVFYSDDIVIGGGIIE